MAPARGRHRRRRGRSSRHQMAALALSAALGLGGLAALGVGFASQQVAPTPSQAALHPSPTPTPTPAAQAAPAGHTAPAHPPPQLVLPRSIPTQLSIPAIGVHHSLIQLGQNPDGTVQVPPLSHVEIPGWYKYSPTPGQIGPAVILGHIDSAASGPGVFSNLGALKPGEKVLVTRADHTTAVFTIDRLGLYPKTHFPTVQVYGNTPDPQLRLITCGGNFDEATGNYVDNTVVYAHLTAIHKPGHG